MDASDCERLWRQICERNTNAAIAISKDEFCDLARRAAVQASNFAELTAPVSGHELNLRRVASFNMTSTWAAEMSQQN